MQLLRHDIVALPRRLLPQGALNIDGALNLALQELQFRVFLLRPLVTTSVTAAGQPSLEVMFFAGGRTVRWGVPSTRDSEQA